MYIKELQVINMLTNVQVISVSGQNFDIRVRKSFHQTPSVMDIRDDLSAHAHHG